MKQIPNPAEKEMMKKDGKEDDKEQCWRATLSLTMQMNNVKTNGHHEWDRWFLNTT